MEKCGIYCLRNLINNKRYVGNSKGLRKRKNYHFLTLRRGRGVNFHLQNSYNKHGEENFIFEVLEYIEDKNCLLERENYWIDFYDTTNPEKGYNMRKSAGSPLGFKWSEESKKRLSESKTGSNNNFFGKKHSGETRKKLSEKRKGKTPSAKLTVNQVYEIKEMIKNKTKVADIADIFKVSTTCIYEIKQGKTWKDV